MRSDLLAALLGTAIVCTTAFATSPTTFTYQGHLAHDGIASDGAYEFEIRLLNNSDDQIGQTQEVNQVGDDFQQFLVITAANVAVGQELEGLAIIG